MTFLPTFSFCAVIICSVGVFKNIQQRGHNAVYGLVYIPITALMVVFVISAIYSAIYGNYMFTDFYSRVIDKVQLFNVSYEYLTGLNTLLFEATVYVGMSLLFASLIHSCFGFIKKGTSMRQLVLLNFGFLFLLWDIFWHQGVIALLNNNFNIFYIFIKISFPILFPIYFRMTNKNMLRIYL